jgi:alkylhydroperoxidase/carboxymuconolactone decarboxylase family protein YurZ
MMTHPLDTIKKADPELFDRVSQNRNFVFQEGALPVKVKYLITLALDAAHGAQGGVASLARQAMSHGADMREITEALRIADFISGVGSVYTASMGLSQVIETE